LGTIKDAVASDPICKNSLRLIVILNPPVPLKGRLRFEQFNSIVTVEVCDLAPPKLYKSDAQQKLNSIATVGYIINYSNKERLKLESFCHLSAPFGGQGA
jgi:hypothetical protein